ncbi:MAG TPA: acyl-CoA desaturase [Cyclobacteriaceae bacterium]|nr:acyl-CoA desaturase [Cyclobacteriaceae bacterium]
MQKLTSDKTQGIFFSVLKVKVDRYFSENRLDRTGETKLYLKSGIQVLSAVLIYAALVFVNPSVWISLLLAVMLGINLAVLGFNVMHEGGHQSFSKHSWLNSVAAYFLNALGGNTHFWKVKHNINHHTYTNIAGMDSDISVEPFMRLHPNQPRLVAHRYQHVYWFVLYGISYMAWVFYEDFVKYFSRKIAVHMPAKSLPLKEHLVFWVTKISYVLIYLALPIIMLGWVKALAGFVIVTFVCGLFISIVFQLAHVVENTDFPAESKIEKEWAVHQIGTTSNFGTSSKLLFWLLGGLNFQVEHHLFPRVSHVHYPQISRLVKETCLEFNIVYHEYKSMAGAFISHLLYLRKMGLSN